MSPWDYDRSPYEGVAMGQGNAQRAGRYVTQITGYRAFIPEPLPPRQPSLDVDDEMQRLNYEATLALGRLDGITETLPNPDLFVSMYVKKEALLSSQIEGTQASLLDVLDVGNRQTEDAREVTNYVCALDYGLERIREDGFPLSIRLLREIHTRLLASGRGSELEPGSLRRSQNWIGAPGSTLTTAVFVPPPADVMQQALGQLEAYLNEGDGLLPLIKVALVHAQFETIHPFLDGNGRMGRLLITLWLCEQGILSRPLLYLSYYFKRNRDRYYDWLMRVREQGDWEGWVRFFLTGVIEIAGESRESAMRINRLREECVQRISISDVRASVNERALLDLLFVTPQVTRASVARGVGVTQPTAGRLIDRLCQMGILHDASPDKTRNKRYRFREYLDILEVGT